MDLMTWGKGCSNCRACVAYPSRARFTGAVRAIALSRRNLLEPCQKFFRLHCATTSRGRGNTMDIVGSRLSLDRLTRAGVIDKSGKSKLIFAIGCPEWNHCEIAAFAIASILRKIKHVRNECLTLSMPHGDP